MSDQLSLDETLATEGEGPDRDEIAPTPQQARAIETRDRDVLLEAGAGTGKTRVLVDRYCEAVASDGVGVDGVVAFTFTDRAAAEMRRRIRVELGARAEAAAGAGHAQAAAELAALARDTERAWISTIHGFCKRLLSAHPVALGLDPRFRVMDEAETDRVAARTFDEALERFLADGEAERVRMVAAIRIPRLREMVRTAHDELRAQGHARPELPPVPPPDPARAVADLASAAAAALEELAGTRAGRANVARIEAAAKLVGDGEPTEEAVAALELKSAAPAFAGPACRVYRDAWRAARRAIVERDNAGVYDGLGELVALFGERFARLKESRSSLDFEDLQLDAVRLLREHPAIAEAYRERFRHLLIDEFQDTNELQLSLVRLLQGPETRLFAVGDEFQSIYGFRHADVRAFRRERDRMAALGDSEAEVLPLSGNFRSLPPIVAAANALGDATLAGYRPLTVGRPSSTAETAAGAEPRVELLLTPGGREWKDPALGIELPGDYPSGPDRVAEARFLAARLRRLHDGGARRGDIVVLLRAFTHVSAFEEQLDRAGLAPYVVGGRGYWSQQQVDDVRRLLSTIANPLDDDCLLGTLASPVCGVLPDTLWLLRRAAGEHRHLWPTLERRFGPTEPVERDGEDESERERWIEAIPDHDAERLRATCARLAELRAEAGYVALDELIELAVTRTGYDLATVSMNGGRGRLANVRKLMRMARQFESAEGRDLRGFLDHLEQRATRDREGEAATEAEDHDGVRVMTVHAAKGLQFPIVAVADLGRELVRFGRGADVRIEAPPTDAPDAARVGIRLARFGSVAVGLFDHERLVEEAAEEEAAESCRLAYVAATRAEDHLILSGCYDANRVARPVPDDGLKPSVSITERLMRALDIAEPAEGTIEIAAPTPRPGLEARFDPGGIAVRVNRPEPEAFAALVAAAPAAAEARSELSGRPPLGRPAALPEPAAGHLSYSALSSYGRCGYRYYVERVIGMPGLDPHAADGDEGGGGRERRFGLGNAVHALLEWSARHGWREPPRGLVAEALRREGVREAKLDRVVGMVRGWLECDLRRDELADPGPRARPEMPFMLRLGDSIVRGSMDVLVATPDGPLVVDYKTDSLDGASPDDLVDRYEVQRKIYAVAAGSGGSHRVRTAYAFLDSGCEVVERDFEPAELEAAAEELEGLIAQVREGRFEVTAEPHRALCWDCPARARLCSYPTEVTKRAR